ncbi:MAG TPA: acetyltransferase [Cyclobacteriaceae bacterium]|nr:acetyltransferase [Cyclobacteriaceae bacterium]
MKDLAIYGAGGLGREMLLMIKQINEKTPTWNIIGFFDDGKKKGAVIDGIEVLGSASDINKLAKQIDVIVPIADSKVRSTIVTSIVNRNISFPPAFHPSANTGDRSNKFGKGCLVTANCVLTTGISVGDFAIINLACTVGHDVRIGNFASLMPGCHISGNVTIGEGAFIGTGAVIRQGITIGDHAIVGAGAVVTRNVDPMSIVVGVPARPMKKRA